MANDIIGICPLLGVALIKLIAADKPDTAPCPGYWDANGFWNNGFECLKRGRPNQKYCCGTETEPYCCPPEKVPDTGHLSTHIPLIVGLAVGGLVLVTMTLIITCFFCRCCIVYKRRKRLNTGMSGPNGHMLINGRLPDYAVNYSVCPHQQCYGDQRIQMYPLEDPPPYTAEPSYSTDEKQPLNPSELYVTTDGPDNTPVTMAVPSNRNYQTTSDAVPGSSGACSSSIDALPSAIIMPLSNLDTMGATSQTPPVVRQLSPSHNRPYLIPNPGAEEPNLGLTNSRSDQTLSSLDCRLHELSEDEWSTTTPRSSRHHGDDKCHHRSKQNRSHGQLQHRSLPLINPRDYQLNPMEEDGNDQDSVNPSLHRVS